MRLVDILTEASSPSSRIAFDFRLAIPVASSFHVGLSSKKSFEESAKLAAESLSSVVGDDVKVRRDPGARSKSSWMIEPSASADRSGSHPIEIVSPFMFAADAMKKMAAVAKWIDENNLRTSDDDYLRAAFHVANMASKLDPVKLVLHLDTPSAELVFAKPTSKFSDAQVDVLLHKLKQTGKLPIQAAALHKAALNYLGQRPDGNTNFGNVPDDTLEFKIGGGAGYEHDIENARKKVFRLSKAVDAATDANYMKADYIRNVGALFSGERKEAASDRSDLLPKELGDLYQTDPEILNAWKLYLHDSENGSAKSPLLVLINRALAAALKRKAVLATPEKAFLKTLARNSNLSSDDVDSFYGHDNLTRMKFKRDFAL